MFQNENILKEFRNDIKYFGMCTHNKSKIP
jgi:hypothetical protein